MIDSKTIIKSIEGVLKRHGKDFPKNLQSLTFTLDFRNRKIITEIIDKKKYKPLKMSKSS